MAVAFGAVGCGATPLPTTLFHARLPAGVAPTEADWRQLVDGPQTTQGGSALVAVASVGGDAFLVWTTDATGRGSLVCARRTELGLEAQSVGTHVGPTVRPTLRVLHVGDADVIVVESSRAPDSTDRDAWLYRARGASLEPMTLDGAVAQLPVRAQRRTPLERGWSRDATLTVTLEADAEGIVVHEHESVRELAEDRPELPARTTYEVERARTLRLQGAALHADRPSLFASAP